MDDRQELVCDNCGLSREPYHNFAGGSMAKKNGVYICNGYSQKKLFTRSKYLKANKDENAESNQLDIRTRTGISLSPDRQQGLVDRHGEERTGQAEV